MKHVYIAAFGTETNQFVPFPTGLAAFERYGIWRGDATKHEPGSFSGPLHVWRRMAEARGWKVTEGLCTFAAPSGTTVRSVYEAFRDEILDGIRGAGPLDAVLLNLHGAMVAEGYDDCEGDLLARVRALVGPDVKVGAELDLHCHLTDAMVDSTTAIVIYKEFPHIDTQERAAELFAVIADAVDGRTRPVMATFDCRMMNSYRTPVEPMKSFVAHMKSLEGKDGILSVSFGHGFAFADVEVVGSRMLVVADADKAKAERLAKRLAREIWDLRNAVRTTYLSPTEVLARAAEQVDGKGPVIVADRADNPGSGATGDTTYLLEALLASPHAQPALMGMIWDPMAVSVAQEAGVGARLEMRIGGKAGRVSGRPVDMTVTVKGLAYDVKQAYGPVMASAGNVAWLQGENGVDVVVTDLRTQTFHPAALEAAGPDLQRYKVVVVKSAQHFYAGFAPVARAVLYSQSPGGANPDYANLPYTKRTTPFWPKVDDPWEGSNTSH